ncbi:MAG: bifunctional hydroxymethylpyrimidine kinase/phosphomethylpyrimidine kinase [Desulfarculaceae bacterium]|nr:bifunctional hydroxymethylpyrimidine kinase/phosphomethylpyrimidine kinase [Desulfarculaceae bacterium]MCF8072781.1 bifunctional hydroxymethylpyrimidine kinase/phosphomethylpyrimidine kinase [Desulfarculaceae bacterium]MCF8100949.1 bifunctional hydroxymethylpyrimidine kinase/phosphomethylpyrimidine kinase [Desulfarculaceae bacterium]MCF8117567.1 bifunctional hydroxymethylpyrimidine kinase/phosphomethylpyrimidine kinase [Desulfarculaceae bacterium]
MSVSRVMIIAGSDSGGGAGIQADLKAVAALGGHASTVITALTAQNTTGVKGVHPIPLDFVEQQFAAVIEDIGAEAVKTGMLHSAELVRLVAGLLAGVQAPVVVDPVMVAKGGDRLLATEAVQAVREALLPRADLVTPNLDEAAELLGRPVSDRAAMETAARELVELGAKAVLVKGGHLQGEPGDLLFDGSRTRFFSAPRIDTPHTHGTGCTLASAIAALLAQGWDLAPAVERARLLVRRAIAGGLAIGQGHGPVHAMADLAPRLALGPCLAEMDAALERMELAEGLANMIPEVRGQLGYALPGAASAAEVLAVAGRITHIGSRLKAAGPARLGASSHVAKIVLAAMAKDPAMRAAMACNYRPELVERARSLGWTVGEFSRAEEPPEVKQMEGSTLEWGTSRAIEVMGQVPEVIFDRGENGKEPVLRLLAKSPGEIVDRLLLLAGKEG